ncbi:MAG TPA: glycoside hydrolase family 3 C-terminal domain-containing protein [Gemmatimonadales bacterium]|nr:glycoside hydrolase family 3 C-terminal domain-containing protein [Gemmatimonadales bacterium]
MRPFSRVLLVATVATCVVAVIAAAPPAAARAGALAADSCPWVRSSAPVAARVAQVVSAMTLDEKIQLVHGASGTVYAGYVPAIPRLCVPALKLHDGPGGVADGLPGVTQLPAPVAVAASWDTAVARSYGAVIGAEEWGKGANVNLGPTVNIVRDPRWGRAFESYGEDPYLAGRIATAEIQGVQGEGVLAQVKHLAAYNQETFRNTPADDVAIGRRALHEIYLPQFEAAIRQGAASSVMCAYSTINGTWACENAYTQDTVLKGEWRFPGFVTSDWGATHSAAAAASHGLDMQMPDSSYLGAALKAAVQAGQLPMSRLDDMVGRILAQEFRFHLFDREQTGTPSSVVTNGAHAALARTVAEQGTVLLKNAGSLLPLDAGAVHSIAVIGPGGGPDAMSGGGGSAAVVAPYVVTPFDGIAKRAGSGVQVRHAQGALPPSGRLPAVPSQVLAPVSGGGHGLTVQFFNNVTLSGDPVATRVDSAVGADWHDQPPAPGVNAEKWSARWTGTLTAPVGGEYTFSLTSDDGSRLLLNGAQVIDNWREQAPTTETAKVTLAAGQVVPIEVDFYQNAGGDSVGLGWRVPSGTSLLDEAVALARSSDVAVVFMSDFETEGADLADIDLPGEQNRLIGAVAAANPRTIVVLNTGSAVTMPWVDSVPAVLEAWYPGQEDGDAIASVLFGDVNPSAKLPVTFPKRLADVPAAGAAQWPGVGGRVGYSEGLLVGYRWYDARDVAPLFPFGFGLSYTTFRFANLRVSEPRGRPVRVGVDVTNTGRRAGADVVQVYVGHPASTGEPPWQLKAFRKVPLAPGQTRHLTFSLDARAFAQWDSTAGGWGIAAGAYRIGVGDASSDLPLRAEVTMGASRPPPGR